MTRSIQIDNMHFYWRIKDSAVEDNPFSSFIQTKLLYDKNDGILKLETDESYWTMMSQMYALEENVGYLQTGHDLAHPYGDEYLQFINKHLNKTKKICDVGAGGLYVISKLKTLGYTTIAIDPSQESKRSGIEMSLEVISQFYEDVDLSGEGIDAFIHYDVLEHVKEPTKFLEKHFRELGDNGTIAFAVPDCTVSIRNGDISMLLAQHVNYFDSKSLELIVKQAGFDVIEICSSSYGGVLFCAATKGRNSQLTSAKGLNTTNNNIDKFFKNVQTKMRTVSEFMYQAEKSKAIVGLYIPLRVFPYLSNFIDYKNFVFIDDSNFFKGKYFDGFSMQIQGVSEVVNHLDSVVIFSPAFGEEIEVKLRDEHSFRGNILSWKYF